MNNKDLNRCSSSCFQAFELSPKKRHAEGEKVQLVCMYMLGSRVGSEGSRVGSGGSRVGSEGSRVREAGWAVREAGWAVREAG